MKEETVFRCEFYAEPNCIGVVCVKKRDNALNLTPITHWFTVENDDKSTLVCWLKKTSYSHNCIIERNKFALAVPAEEIKQQVHDWSRSSGWDSDKLKKFPAPTIDFCNGEYTAPEQSAAVYLCKMKQYLPCGNGNLFICSIEGSYGDEKLKPLFGWDNNVLIGKTIRPKSVDNGFKKKIPMNDILTVD